MRRWLLVVYLFLIAATVRADVLRGAWHLSQGEHHLLLEMTRASSHFGHSIEASAFRGLSASAMNATVETPVRFQLAREAGTFDFDGTFLNADGVGRFTFTPDASYADRLRSLGVTAFRIHGVTPQFARDVRDRGVSALSADRLVAMRIHGVTTDFVRGSTE